MKTLSISRENHRLDLDQTASEFPPSIISFLPHFHRQTKHLHLWRKRLTTPQDATNYWRRYAEADHHPYEQRPCWFGKTGSYSLTFHCNVLIMKRLYVTPSTMAMPHVTLHEMRRWRTSLWTNSCCLLAAELSPFLSIHLWNRFRKPVSVSSKWIKIALKLSVVTALPSRNTVHQKASRPSSSRHVSQPTSSFLVRSMCLSSSRWSLSLPPLYWRLGF